MSRLRAASARGSAADEEPSPDERDECDGVRLQCADATERPAVEERAEPEPAEAEPRGDAPATGIHVVTH